MKHKWLKVFFYYTIIFLLAISLIFTIYFIGKERKNTILIVVLIMIYVLNLIFNIIIFSTNKTDESKQSWQLVFAAIPLVGHLFYIIFGQKYNNELSHEEYKKESALALVSNNNYSSTHVFNTQENDFLKLNKLSKLTNRKIMPANIITHDNGHYYFKSIFSSMEKAKKYIFIEMYIIKNGEIFEQLKDILIKKVAEGVDVKILIDDFGSWDIPRSVIKELIKQGASVKVIEKINFPFITGSNNYRSHRKFIIVDGIKVFTGGSNISDEYVNYSVKYGIWKDANIELEGPVIENYIRLFKYDWEIHTDSKLNIQLNNHYDVLNYKNLIVTAEDGPRSEFAKLESTIVKLFNEANSEIKIATPYFIPSSRLEKAILDSLEQGIKVTIYIPGLWDKSYVYFSTIAALKPFVAYGLEIKIVKNCFLHSKMAVIDNELAYIGTLNLDHRSFYSQHEITNFIIGEGVNDINKIFDSYDKLNDEAKIKKLLYRYENPIAFGFRKLFKPLL
ncbi:phospholipase D-like domain-containing protein [Mycoplasma phocoenae]|uniref:PLD phosphodiesterase domain-containing protein n=1 Tax=Mycoplasma phocoenae TaxID=754517 RepID=A0A858U169_9MOLU|nr:phospholipase D-like domain-containing protein [Mycoplasma phocoenae]QJG66854.1 hypothetical protein HGG69_00735 [Mycoplasma phocoenae]